MLIPSFTHRCGENLPVWERYDMPIWAYLLVLLPFYFWLSLEKGEKDSIQSCEDFKVEIKAVHYLERWPIISNSRTTWNVSRPLLPMQENDIKVGNNERKIVGKEDKNLTLVPLNFQYISLFSVTGLKIEPKAETLLCSLP